MSVVSFGCHSRGVDASGISQGDATKRPTRHRTAPQKKELCGCNVNSAKLRELTLEGLSLFCNF